MQSVTMKPGLFCDQIYGYKFRPQFPAHQLTKVENGEELTVLQQFLSISVDAG